LITKFKDCFSDKKLNEEGVPQGSILDSTKQTVLPRLIFNDILIPIVFSAKLLGVIIDNKLKFYLNSKDSTQRVAY